MSTPNPFDLPVVIGSAGAQPQDPTVIRTQIRDAAVANSPGITTDLPGILIEDILSTQVPGVSVCDNARVELINSLDPGKANEALLIGLGSVNGIHKDQPSNTTVPVQFSAAQVGYVVPQGLLVGDGSNNVFQLNEDTVIGGGGTSAVVTAIAIQPGAFGVPSGTVNRIRSSVPPNINLTVTNPSDGTPGDPNGETWASFRSRLMVAQRAVCTSGPSLIKTLVSDVPGVQKNLVSAQQASSGIRVIVGGGDVYAVALAIFQAVGDPNLLQPKAAGGTTQIVTLIDPPNTYQIKSVIPVQQTAALNITWNTNAPNFTGGGAFASLVQPPLVNYLNNLQTGSPINILEMNDLFKKAISGVLDPDFLVRLVFQVLINGTPVAPATGEYIVIGDAEGFFFTATDGSQISVAQG